MVTKPTQQADVTSTDVAPEPTGEGAERSGEYSEVEWLEAERARITAEAEANAAERRQWVLDNSVIPPTDGNGGTPATGATAGTPGTWEPAGSTPPADLAACASVTATPATAWVTGEYVVLGDASEATWSGTAWASGRAP